MPTIHFAPRSVFHAPAEGRHAAAPNPPHCDCLNATQQKARLAARSFHSGGVNVLFCDGSVRLVADGVPLPAWRAMATRAGGEPIAE